MPETQPLPQPDDHTNHAGQELAADLSNVVPIRQTLEQEQRLEKQIVQIKDDLKYDHRQNAKIYQQRGMMLASLEQQLAELRDPKTDQV